MDPLWEFLDPTMRDAIRVATLVWNVDPYDSHNTVVPMDFFIPYEDVLEGTIGYGVFNHAVVHTARPVVVPLPYSAADIDRAVRALLAGCHISIVDMDDECVPSNFLKGCQHVDSICIMSMQDRPRIIGDNFLSGCTNITTFDTKGLTSVAAIQDYAFSQCSNLTLVDTCGLTSVTAIGNCFLVKAGITAFDTVGMTSVTKIGYYFLADCRNMTEIDTGGLGSVCVIKDNFLVNCKTLTNFSTAGMTCLTRFGTYFLSGCSSLTTFDGAGMTAVSSVADAFLFKCTNLTTIKLEGLTSVTKTGTYFLHGCTNLSLEAEEEVETFLARFQP
jgi:hypothetical protein